MRKPLLILIALLSTLMITAQTKPSMNYNSSWKKVADFEEKSLPKSASEEVNKILKQAIADKNSPQVIKALIHQGKYDLAIDAENDTLIFRNLNDMVAKSTDVVEKSVLHSMLGELYLQYYQKNSWQINQRTELGDFVSADMKEWTKHIFFDHIVEHLNASMQAQAPLEKAQVTTYAAVVELGKDSRRFFPSMYDFLACRALDVFKQIDSDEDLSRVLGRKNIASPSLFAPADEFVKLPFNPQPSEYGLWALETYKTYLKSLLARKMDKSVVLMELDKLDYLQRLSNIHKKYALSSLETMLKKWEKQGFSVEIVEKMANYYEFEIGEISVQDSLKKEEKTKELYQFLQKTVRAFPSYERISLIENQISQLTQPEFSVSGNNTFSIKGKKELTLTYKNLRSLTAKLYKVPSPTDVVMVNMGIPRNVTSKRVFVKDIAFSFPPQPEYWEGETTFLLDVDAPGTYVLSFESSPQETNKEQSDYYFSVSDLAVFARSSAKDTYDFFVVNRDTGEPIKNAQVKIYHLPGNWQTSTLTLTETISTNAEGLAVYYKKIPNRDVFYHAVSANDAGSLLSSLPYSYYEYSNPNEMQEQQRADLFTDRILYRPGQTVFFKAILTSTMNQKTSVAANKSIDISLRDINYQEISKQTLTTNEFGSVSGEFVLPPSVLSGNFTISTKNGELSIRVEEYKRPTFEITFDKIEKTYKFGEEITLKGKAESFSGIQLQSASVNYRITRQQSWWWRWGGSSEHFTEGVTTTDENGAFNIVFTPQKTDVETSQRSVFSFVVEASITDANGETQIATYTVTVGDVSMMLNLEMPDKWEKSASEKIVITAKNLDGNDISAKGDYQIFSLNENDSIRQQVAQGAFETGEQKALKEQLLELPSGKYKIKLQSKDDRGNMVETEKDVIIFSYNDKHSPIKTNEWLVRKNTIFGKNKNAEIILGVSEKVNVLYELWQQNTLLERKWMVLNNENKLFSLPYKAEYKNGATLMLTYVKNEKFYAHAIELTPEKETKELKVTLDVFRDKIRPGADEEWRVSVKDAIGNPALAEVLAGMYDFSLDNIFPTEPWRLQLPSFNSYYSRMNLQRDNSFDRLRKVGYIHLPLNNIVSFEFDNFNWFDFSLYYYGRMMMRGAKAGNVQTQSYAVMESAAPAVQDVLEITEEKVATANEDLKPQMSPLDSKSQIRRNFNETAFFFPQLRTNEKGETQIAFRVPDSNTRWRFRVLAHDKNLNTGYAEAIAVSQKELMVTPNMPRFLRQGDRASISTKISNLSDGAIDGTVRIEFFDILTDKTMAHISVENPSKPFSLAKDASSDAAWTFDVPSNIELLGVRVIAQSASFSDGEQHALAVLPNRMLVTESMRMDVNGTQTKSFTMNRLTENASPTAQNYRLTLEFTSNPAWYAVQALPVLSAPDNENAVSWFAAYYANTLGAHIGKTYPKVSAMIDAWKKQGGTSETLFSNLEKNQELKNVLLEETPWALESKNEAEQKQKLALLFDLNRSENLTNTAIQKLKELQTSQGGWSWFKGFYPSVSITQYVLYGFNQLKELQAATFGDDVRAMQSAAVSYIDAEAIRRFDALKKYNKNWRAIKTISSTDLEYLYVRTSYNALPLSAAAKEMTAFYTSVIEKNWTQFSLYERSLIAVLMQRNGKTTIVQNILKSYREHATVSDEMGMFWANNRTHVFMSQSAVSVHTFIMDAFRVGNAKADETDNMKRWLLKQKQTQLWESTHATLDAVYALLSTGSDWFSTQGATTITLDNQTVEPAKTELGTGYFKESWSRGEIRSEMGNVRVVHNGNAPAWGALYLQYFEALDQITKTDASLDVEKLLFVEKTDASGKKLVRITETNPLKVGDKVVVRLTVRADRDLEFVHLKDMRAACFEPAEQISGLRWQNGAPYYQTSKDASTNFYFDVLPRGTYVFEYAVFVNRTGSYSNGITTIQCMYAPEFTSHTGGIRVVVEP